MLPSAPGIYLLRRDHDGNRERAIRKPTNETGWHVMNATSPVPAAPATAALAAVYKRRAEVQHAFEAVEDRPPKTVSPRDQARAAGAK
jgi:hypothetical protein